uniref:Uncharacterized protein n=1 Tax=Oryza meridionalis TaxID=40149 RepID=A0A0E0F8X7_9ORYZ
MTLLLEGREASRMLKSGATDNIYKGSRRGARPVRRAGDCTGRLGGTSSNGTGRAARAASGRRTASSASQAPERRRRRQGNPIEHRVAHRLVGLASSRAEAAPAGRPDRAPGGAAARKRRRRRASTSSTQRPPRTSLSSVSLLPLSSHAARDVGPILTRNRGQTLAPRTSVGNG